MRGVHRHGRTDIEAWFASLFKGNLKASNRTDTVRSIRFFTPQMATVDADTLITGTKTADGSEVPPRKGLMIVTMTKQNGHWLISGFHEAEFPAPPPPPRNKLRVIRICPIQTRARICPYTISSLGKPALVCLARRCGRRLAAIWTEVRN